MKRVFVTGGNGMVGRNTVERLQTIYQVFAPSRNEVDLTDPKATLKAIDSFQPDFLLHCAGLVGGIQANINAPVRFLTENLVLGLNVVNAAAKVGVPRLMNFGSSCMYPKDRTEALSESMILTGALEPTNEGYALAKIAVSKLCDYHERENSSLHYRTVVPCNLYGKYDQFDPIKSHLVPAAIRKIHEAKASGQKAVTVWGSGGARREFMFAGDLAEFVAYSLLDFDRLPNVLNVGLGDDHTINDYYRTVAQVVGYHGEFVHDLTKPEGMARKLINVERLNQFGWKSGVSLQTGLQLTYQYFLDKEIIK